MVCCRIKTSTRTPDIARPGGNEGMLATRRDELRFGVEFVIEGMCGITREFGEGCTRCDTLGVISILSLRKWTEIHTFIEMALSQSFRHIWEGCDGRSLKKK